MSFTRYIFSSLAFQVATSPFGEQTNEMVIQSKVPKTIYFISHSSLSSLASLVGEAWLEYKGHDQSNYLPQKSDK